MKLSNTLVAPLAAILIVTGAGAVLATTNNHAVDLGSAPAAAATASPAPGAVKPTPPPPQPPKDLVAVLDKLVADGAITAAQETKILDGLVSQKLADRAAHEALKALLETITADGVVTQDELNKLPADSPMRDLSKFMTNGKISLDQIQSLGKALHGWGHGPGPGGPKP